MRVWRKHLNCMLDPWLGFFALALEDMMRNLKVDPSSGGGNDNMVCPLLFDCLGLNWGFRVYEVMLSMCRLLQGMETHLMPHHVSPIQEMHQAASGGVILIRSLWWLSKARIIRKVATVDTIIQVGNDCCFQFSVWTLFFVEHDLVFSLFFRIWWKQWM